MKDIASVHRGIRWKLLTTMGGLIIGLVGLMTYLQISSQHQILQRDLAARIPLLRQVLVERAKTLSDELGRQTENDIAAFNFSGITARFKAAVAENPELRYAILMDRAGTAHIHTSRPELEQERLDDEQARWTALQTAPVTRETSDDGAPVLERVVPLKAGVQEWGWLRLGFSLEPLNQEIVQSRGEMAQRTRAMIVNSMVTSVIFIALGTALVGWLAIRLSQPLTTLTESVRQLAKGDFGAASRLRIRPGDEVGVLAEAFVNMSEDLKASYQKLEGYSRTLEDRVAERTEALQKQTRVVELLQAVAVAANEASKTENAFQCALERVCDYAGWPAGCAYLAEPGPEEGAIRLAPLLVWHAADAGRYAALRAAASAPQPLEGGLAARVLESGQPAWATELTSYRDQALYRSALDAGLSGASAYPVTVGKGVAAVLEFFADQPGKPDAALLALMAHIGPQLGRVIERERAERAIRAAKDAADQASRAKSSFLASMSHEIRTPMNAILGYAQILRRDSGLAPAHRAAVETIERSGLHLLAMINDILDLSKIEAGRMELHESDFDLNALLNAVVSMIRIRCEEKHLAMLTSGLSDAALPVRGDEGKLRQILINLLGNAVKFTDRGSVTLCVRPLLADHAGANSGPAPGAAACPKPAEGRTHYRFEVVDTGPGLSEDAQAKLFEPFHQGREGHQKGGTGLGLAITKRQVELMGGVIGVDSRPGAGATFFFEIPLAAASSLQLPRLKESRPEIRGLARGVTLRALVLDDDQHSREVLAQMLQSLQAEVAIAAEGREALRKIEVWKPQIVFTDIRMPEMDGPEVLRRIHRQYGSRAMKVVAVSASTLAHEQQSYLEAGFDSFLSKPLRFDALCECLENVLHVQFDRADAAEPAATDAAPALDPTGLALPAALRRQLMEAAARHSMTRLEQAFASLEKLGQAERAAAADFRRLAAAGKIETVIEWLDKTREAGANA